MSTTDTNVTAEQAKAELDRRAYNRKHDERREAASPAVFRLGKAELEAIIASAPAAETYDVAIVRDTHGTEVVHMAGCNHVKKQDEWTYRLRGGLVTDGWEATVATRYDAACDVYDNGIMDESDKDRDDVAYWEGVIDFAPCAAHIPSAS